MQASCNRSQLHIVFLLAGARRVALCLVLQMVVAVIKRGSAAGCADNSNCFLGAVRCLWGRQERQGLMRN